MPDHPVRPRASDAKTSRADEHITRAKEHYHHARQLGKTSEHKKALEAYRLALGYYSTAEVLLERERMPNTPKSDKHCLVKYRIIELLVLEARCMRLSSNGNEKLYLNAILTFSEALSLAETEKIIPVWPFKLERALLYLKTQQSDAALKDFTEVLADADYRCRKSALASQMSLDIFWDIHLQIFTELDDLEIDMLTQDQLTRWITQLHVFLKLNYFPLNEEKKWQALCYAICTNIYLYLLPYNHKTILSECNKAIKYDPNKGVLYLTRAEIHVRHRDRKLALKDINKAIELLKDALLVEEAKAFKNGLLREMAAEKQREQDTIVALQKEVPAPEEKKKAVTKPPEPPAPKASLSAEQEAQRLAALNEKRVLKKQQKETERQQKRTVAEEKRQKELPQKIATDILAKLFDNAWQQIRAREKSRAKKQKKQEKQAQKLAAIPVTEVVETEKVAKTEEVEFKQHLIRPETAQPPKPQELPSIPSNHAPPTFTLAPTVSDTPQTALTIAAKRPADKKTAPPAAASTLPITFPLTNLLAKLDPKRATALEKLARVHIGLFSLDVNLFISGTFLLHSAHLIAHGESIIDPCDIDFVIDLRQTPDLLPSVIYILAAHHIFDNPSATKEQSAPSSHLSFCGNVEGFLLDGTIILPGYVSINNFKLLGYYMQFTGGCTLQAMQINFDPSTHGNLARHVQDKTFPIMKPLAHHPEERKFPLRLLKYYVRFSTGLKFLLKQNEKFVPYQKSMVAAWLYEYYQTKLNHPNPAVKYATLAEFDWLIERDYLGYELMDTFLIECSKALLSKHLANSVLEEVAQQLATLTQEFYRSTPKPKTHCHLILQEGVKWGAALRHPPAPEQFLMQIRRQFLPAKQSMQQYSSHRLFPAPNMLQDLGVHAVQHGVRPAFRAGQPE